MFKTPEALNPDKHASLRYEPNLGYSFAAGQTLVPILASEAAVAAREYVLLFDRDRPLLSALLAVEEGQNAYVNDRGQWFARYLPAYVRIYPFGLIVTPGTQPDADGRSNYTLIADVEAAQLRDPGGTPLFDVDGRPTAVVGKVQEVLKTLEYDSQRTSYLADQLAQAGVLAERSIVVKGRDLGLTGFRVVDRQALGQLAPDALAKLRDTGALALAYAQLMSLANLSDGTLARAVKGGVDGAGDRKVRELFDGDFDIDLDFMN